MYLVRITSENDQGAVLYLSKTLESCRTFTIVSEEETYCLLTWDGQSKYGAVEYKEDTVAELKDLLRNNGFSHVELEINTIIPEENLFTLKVEE